jgi:hypothetical protein
MILLPNNSSSRLVYLFPNCRRSLACRLCVLMPILWNDLEVLKVFLVGSGEVDSLREGSVSLFSIVVVAFLKK